MSTLDVPGQNPANHDELAMGCWAEHSDGSLIFVQSNENGRVIYSIFDMSVEPLVEYRHAMSESDFKNSFTWAPEGKAHPARDATGRFTKPLDSDAIRWTWHDKSPFPWDKVIKRGATPGEKYASAHDMLSAAARVAESLELRGNQLTESKLQTLTHLRDQAYHRVGGMLRRLADKMDRRFPPDNNKSV